MFRNFHIFFLNFYCRKNSPSIPCFVLNKKHNCIALANHVHDTCPLITSMSMARNIFTLILVPLYSTIFLHIIIPSLSFPGKEVETSDSVPLSKAVTGSLASDDDRESCSENHSSEESDSGSEYILHGRDHVFFLLCCYIESIDVRKKFTETKFLYF